MKQRKNLAQIPSSWRTFFEEQCPGVQIESWIPSHTAEAMPLEFSEGLPVWTVILGGLSIWGFNKNVSRVGGP